MAVSYTHRANIALALANLGVDSTFFSVVPNNSLGKSAVRWLRSNDVHCLSLIHILTERYALPALERMTQSDTESLIAPLQVIQRIQTLGIDPVSYTHLILRKSGVLAVVSNLAGADAVTGLQVIGATTVGRGFLRGGKDHRGAVPVSYTHLLSPLQHWFRHRRFRRALCWFCHFIRFTYDLFCICGTDVYKRQGH